MSPHGDGGAGGLAGATSHGLKRYVPILSWLPHYDRSWLTVDAIAGLTLWGLVVPEGMAYAGIAGLPPQAGLYTLVASLLIYALLGTSRHLSVQATSATAALLATSVAAAVTTAGSTADLKTYVAYAAAFVLVTGVMFLAAGVARLGFITQFLSKPVMDGFVVGLAIYVTVGQLYKLLGVDKPSGNTIEKLVGTLKELPQADATSTDMVISLLKQLRENGIDAYFADVRAPILEHGRQTGLLDAIGEDHVFPTVDAAARHIEQADRPGQLVGGRRHDEQ
jgi:MFS superfamily sulfate permease-like transporter